MADEGTQDLEGRHFTNFVSCIALSGDLMVKDDMSGSKLRARLAYVEKVGQHRSKEPLCSSDLLVVKG